MGGSRGVAAPAAAAAAAALCGTSAAAAAGAGAGAVAVYPPTPGAEFDDRLELTVGGGGGVVRMERQTALTPRPSSRARFAAGGPVACRLSVAPGARSVRLRTVGADIPVTVTPTAGPAAAGGREGGCSVTLTQQISSHVACVEGATFGCSGHGTMWVDGGCRGVFSCDGAAGVDCESVGRARAECACGGGGAAARLDFTLPGPGHYYMSVDTLDGWLFFWVDTPDGLAPPAGPLVTDVSAAGAAPDPSALRTAVLQRLIDTAAAGAVLYFPPGTYRSAALSVRRRAALTLWIDAGAVLRAPDDAAQCPQQWGAGFIQVDGAANFTLAGRGTVDANGCGGNAIFVTRSSDVAMRDVHVRNSREWAVPVVGCSGFTATNIKIFSGKDGVDPDSSSDVTLDGVFIQSMDDAVAVKATLAGVATQRVVVRDSIVSTKKSALKVGTESRAPFTNVTFSRVDVFDTDRGIVIYAEDGGAMENIAWRDIRLSFFHYTDESKDGRVFDLEITNRSGLSTLRNITMDNIDADVIAASRLQGSSGWPLANITMRNVTLRAQPPIHSLPALFKCRHVAAEPAVAIHGLTVDWGAARDLWAGVEEGSPCVAVDPRRAGG